MGVHRGSCAQRLGAGLVGTQPVGGSVNSDDYATVEEPVEHGSCHHRVFSERGGPGADADIGGSSYLRWGNAGHAGEADAVI
jgi:hypothetical protein